MLIKVIIQRQALKTQGTCVVAKKGCSMKICGEKKDFKSFKLHFNIITQERLTGYAWLSSVCVKRSSDYKSHTLANWRPTENLDSHNNEDLGATVWIANLLQCPMKNGLGRTQDRRVHVTSIIPSGIPTQSNPDECHRKYKQIGLKQALADHSDN